MEPTNSPSSTSRNTSRHPYSDIVPSRSAPHWYDLQTRGSSSTLWPSGNTWQNGWCITEIAEFREESFSWYRPRQREERFATDKKEIATVTSKPSRRGIAYYVKNFRGAGVILEALHLEIYMPDRGDLRRVLLNIHSLNLADGCFYNAKHAFMVGDIVIVHSLVPSGFGWVEGQAVVFNQSPTAAEEPHFRALWNVSEYVVAERKYVRSRLITALFYTDGDEVRCAIEGMPELVTLKKDVVRDLAYSYEMPVFEADVFLPVDTTGSWTCCPENEEDRRKLEQIAKTVTIGEPPKPVLRNLNPLSRAAYDMIMERRNGQRKGFGNTKPIENVICTMAMTTAGLQTFTDQKCDLTDRQLFVSRLSPPTNGKMFVEFQIQSQYNHHKQGSWPSGRIVTIRESESDFVCSGHVERTSSDDVRWLEVIVQLNGHDAKTLNERFEKYSSPLLFWVCQDAPLLNPTSRFFIYINQDELNSLIRKIDRAKVMTKFRSLFGYGRSRQRPSLVYTNAGLDIVTYNGETVYLSRQQVEITKAVSSEYCSVVFVRAGPGTGKTFTVAVASLHSLIIGNQEVHVGLAHTNNAVENCVEAASKLGRLEEFPILRIISEKNFRESENTTLFDLPYLLRKYITTAEFIASLRSKEEFDAVEHYIKALDATCTAELDEIDPFNEKELLRLWTQTARPTMSGRVVVRCFLRFFQPKRIFATLDTGLAAFDSHGVLHDFNEEITFVAVDECSQVGDATALHIIATFPEARLALVGDDRQLSPFTPLGVSRFSAEMSTGNLLDRIVEHRLVPIYPLTDVYRGHPELTRHISKLFYENSLQPAVSVEERSSVIETLDMPNRTSPWALLHHHFLEARSATSWRNYEEEDFIIRLLFILIVVHQIPVSDIAVLSLYRAQANAIANRVLQEPAIRGVFIGTADAAQGREWRIVVVSTVRTTTAAGTAFFQARDRANVVLSRAREACIVLLHEELQFAPGPWRQLAERLRRDGCTESSAAFLTANQ